EPATRLFTQGMVIKDGAKMSKSKGNVVSADEAAERYGSDTARLFVLFAAPPEKDVDWQDAGVEGMVRFLGRVYRFVTRNADAGGGDGSADARILRKLHQVIRKVTEDFDSRWHFNTSLAAIMELVNQLYAAEASLSVSAMREVLEKLVLLLGPFAPYVAEELWEELGKAGPVFKQPWPEFDPDLAREELAEVVVQINGKLRSRIHAPFGTPTEDLEKAALADEKVQAALAGKQVVKAILVPDRLVNIVAR
ncbi:MAG TPA: class I tRNA ligase family protein, partial [Bryobacteraceae bacterium]|nr:class I tRNA ligase family protein [Bryobacteraceae bacterium]